MLSSPVLSWALTAVFAVTGSAAGVRLVSPVRAVPADRSDGRVAELAHLLMSVAMIVMVWGHGEGPSPALAAVQIGVFALLAVPFLVSAARPGRGHGRVGDACHLVTTLAMVWMVATPVLWGVGAGGTTGSPPMGGMGGPAPPGWVAADVGVVVLLALVAARWASRVRGRGPADRTRGWPAVCHLLMSAGTASMLLAMA